MHASEWVRSWRFLLSRRWVLFALAVLVLAYGTWWLGEWQFGRLDDRKDRNAVIRANEDRPPAPVDEVLSPGGDVAERDEWRVVSATGTYDASDTVVVRYRTRDGIPGVNAVVPLVTPGGTALLVDRGWMQTDNRGTTAADLPAPPEGEVTVTAWVRADGTGDSTRVADQSTRAISSSEIGPALDREVYGGFVELRSETPEPAESLARVELPELDNGPHFFYGLQWWFFGILAVGGFTYLARDEWKHGPRSARRRPRPSGRTPVTAGPSQRPQQPAVDREHRPGDERRGG
ncbi:SURF1 family protein [Nocardioides panacisoli]|uniref:SURF1 family cytochrome oxidase biogenesis protein n=1 Tax=Nocardioides panacisoli TaxID=627624 RepID=UPI001C62C201|nr:SURF1 family protein [Nocardioides panacisoli]QYJ05000.1 SURF1 family protein [Nocardioides panacisoli]